jgi:hypothetical protein
MVGVTGAGPSGSSLKTPFDTICGSTISWRVSGHADEDGVDGGVAVAVAKIMRDILRGAITPLAS